ncbi:TrmH family RNA methyltransferase [Hydrocarboniclastica marina]|uniref:RNA methyltransferase n=1 Tax=Hydrocarboniclastica marina TaxID=2259620 RepID=A0A4V1D8P9_9ALTE|nr:RNA methyltransferase [Hydrocarboniclastica marina]MAL96817.1 rRNA methyltransferase [Alteromonadaceae bacterium]QCF25950.1 RNA methyltransferase [Hydrocarboniclastica marina]
MKLDDIKKLHQKKYRQSLGHFLVEGEHLVLELEKAAEGNSHWQQAQLFVTGAYQDWPSPWPKTQISDRQMAQFADTKSPQGILAVAPLPPAAGSAPGADASSASTGKAVYLHEVQDPGNLGTILRTLAWFGGLRCLLSPGSVDPFNPKVVRSSMGAVFHVPIETEVSLAALGSRYSRIACLDIGGEPLTSPDFHDHDCYLFGNEARGVPAEVSTLAAQRFTIPGAAAIESLNLASAVNMAVYELNRT